MFGKYKNKPIAKVNLKLSGDRSIDRDADSGDTLLCLVEFKVGNIKLGPDGNEAMVKTLMGTTKRMVLVPEKMEGDVRQALEIEAHD